MKKICKNIWLAAACMFMLTACSQKSNKTVIDNEPTTITWIEDKPGGNVQPISLYPDVPDSLWNALGLKDGVPSSMSCFLLKTEGKGYTKRVRMNGIKCQCVVLQTEEKIPEGYYFVVGDNRPVSNDSRYIGLIKEEDILGKTSFVIFPFNRFGNKK